MEEAPENGKESSHSAYANGMIELMKTGRQNIQHRMIASIPSLQSARNFFLNRILIC